MSRGSQLDSEKIHVIRTGGSSVLPWLLVVLLVAGIGAAGYYGYPYWQGEQAKIAQGRRDLDEAEKKMRELIAANEAAQQQIAVLEQHKAELNSERDELAEQVHQKDTALEQLKSTYNALDEKMKAEIAKGDIRLSQSGGRIRVDLVDKILFESGRAELSPQGLEVLGRLGAVLMKIDDRMIQVSGHTDNAPITEKLADKYPTNWELSVSRAVNVVRFLSEKAQVKANRLVAAGHGQYHPIANNVDKAGRARNRRIEILLTPMMDSKRAKIDAKAARK